MYTILVSVSVILAILLIIIVLLQSSKGGGLAGTFGGGGLGTMFGSRRTADFLSRATWWISGSLIILIVLINLFFIQNSAVDSRESVIQKSHTVPTAPALPNR